MAITINGTTGIAGVDGSASTPSYQGNDTNTGIFFPAADTIAFGEGGAEAMRIDSSGNVGIGTASPVSKLNVNGGSVTLAETTTGVYNIDFQSRTASTNARIQYDQLTNTTGQLLFYTNGGSLTERARIDSSGNLLVGTTGYFGGTARLSITATAAAQNVLQTRPTTNITYYPSIFENSSGTTVGYIQSTASATSYVTSSDYRLKEAIAPMAGALAKVALLNPVTYKWKSTGEATQGFIAHELQAVVPECVTGEKDAVDADGNPVYQGVDTSFLVATLTAAIQELKAELDTTKARLAALEAN